MSAQLPLNTITDRADLPQFSLQPVKTLAPPTLEPFLEGFNASRE